MIGRKFNLGELKTVFNLEYYTCKMCKQILIKVNIMKGQIKLIKTCRNKSSKQIDSTPRDLKTSLYFITGNEQFSHKTDIKQTLKMKAFVAVVYFSSR